MLSFKPILCPPPELIQDTLQPIAEMVVDYCIELGVGDGIFDMNDFVTRWVAGDHHLMGIYAGEELVGMVVSTSRYKLFSKVQTLTAEMIYIKRLYRQKGATVMTQALAVGKSYAKSLGMDSLVIHADIENIKALSPGDGAQVYTAVEYVL